MKHPVNEIEHAAAEWAAKVDRGVIPAELETDFKAWIGADLRHLGAYLKVQVALARLARLCAEAQRRRGAADSGRT